jgi:hypothetical protein
MRRATYVGARQEKGAEDEAQIAKELGGDKETTDGSKEYQTAVRHGGQFAELLVDLVHGRRAKWSIMQHTMLLSLCWDGQ